MRWNFVVGIILGLLAISFSNSLAEDFDDDVVVSDEVEADTPSETVDDTVNYQSPYAEPGAYYFADHFDNEDTFKTKWVLSEAKKDDISEEIAKYDGVWSVEAPQRQILKSDLGLVLKSKAKHAAISSRLNAPFVFKNSPLVVQYEVTMQEGQECGGAYLKLLSSGKETTDLKTFQDKTPYTIMFGPDKCGNDIKLHFIFKHTNPLNGTVSEKHCRKPKERTEEPFKDKQPHLYQLIIRPDNTFTISLDHRVINEGSLLNDFNPSVNPTKEIDDPTDHKPENWDEREKIPDPTAKKPAEWDEEAPPQVPDPSTSKPEGWLDDEEEMIPDPSAVKPEDWDQDMDGDWEAPLIANPICEKAVGCGYWKAPLISNPHYKGKWRAALIDNPNYQGKWAPRKINNPDFYEDLHPFKMAPIAAIGFEIWSMSSDILFDNIVITDNEEKANEWAAQTYDLKRKQIDREAETFVTRIVNVTAENPWLWGVYVVLIGLPIYLVIYLFCSSSSKDIPKERAEAAAAAAAAAKKNDSVTADDGAAQDDEDEEEEEEAAAIPQKSSQKGKKSDLDEPAQAAVEEPEDEDEDNEDEADEDEEEEPVEQVEDTAVEPPQNDGARKRKSRKE